VATGKTREKVGKKAATLAASYFELVRRHPLRTIRSETELDRAIALVDELLDNQKRDAGQEEYLDVLGTLIHQFEEKHYPDEPVSDSDMIRYFMDARRLTQAEICKGTGIDKTTLSLILAGKRRLTRDHIEALARFFKTDPAVFFTPKPRESEKPLRRPKPARGATNRA
jgi:HTH-type transcriptional regulator/antitoxin HigA